jgi:cytochrome b pre-mRNA-processing protein 3
MIAGLFPGIRRRNTIDALYGAIVAQARLPVFYSGYHVPDTVAGRLEMILIHAFLFSRRTRNRTETMQRIGQGVFDRFCDDMDANLREMGVGDLAVPKHMRRIGEAFYGRATAYDAALTAAQDSALAQALIRNVFAGAQQCAERAERLASYIKAADFQLAQQEDVELTQGRISFPDPQTFN